MSHGTVHYGISLLPRVGALILLISFRQLFIHSPHCIINFTIPFPSLGWGGRGGRRTERKRGGGKGGKGDGSWIPPKCTQKKLNNLISHHFSPCSL